MEKRDKRLYIIVTVIIVAVVLLFLAKRVGIAGAGNSTVINNSGGITMGGGGVGYDLGDMPAVSYVGGDYQGGNQNFQKPCGLCFAGYTRNVLPAPPAPVAQVQEMIRYVSSQPVRLPSPAPSRAVSGSWTAAPQPAPVSFWNVAGRFF